MTPWANFYSQLYDNTPNNNKLQIKIPKCGGKKKEEKTAIFLEKSIA